MSNHSHIEDVFRLLDREVWIVTSQTENRRGGLAATWVSQASIDSRQPTVLAAIGANHFTAELMEASGAFALHLITPEHIDLVWNFGVGAGRTRDKLDGLATTTATTGAPILRDCLAWLDCQVFARVDLGDRRMYLADVVAGEVCQQANPLTERQLFDLANDEQKKTLAECRQSDVEIQRPLFQRWRQQLPEIFKLSARQ